MELKSLIKYRLDKMGLTQSTPQPPTTESTTKVEDAVIKAEETVTKTEEVEKQVTPDVDSVSTKSEPEKKATEEVPVESKSEVFERYVETPGTKVEVAPVEVLPSDDVVKKSKKNKNKNKQKKTE